MAPEAGLYIMVAPMPKTTYLQRKEKGEINKLKDIFLLCLDPVWKQRYPASSGPL